MKNSFKCANCGKVTEFIVPSKVSLMCQVCGCVDISFSSPMLVAPAYLLNNDAPPFTPIEANTPFLGRHSQGEIWSTDPPKDYDPTPDSEKKKPGLVSRRK
jgi:hypothetical protein